VNGLVLVFGGRKMGKGSKRRPSSTTREEEDLRWKLAFGKITFKQYEKKYKELLKAGKIQRNGRVIKNV
jgi:hypothetical protein